MFWYSNTKCQYPGQFAKRNKNTVIDTARTEPRSEAFVSLHMLSSSSTVHFKTCLVAALLFQHFGDLTVLRSFVAHCDRGRKIILQIPIQYSNKNTLIKNPTRFRGPPSSGIYSILHFIVLSFFCFSFCFYISSYYMVWMPFNLHSPDPWWWRIRFLIVSSVGIL
jgi:hypothetical protein